MSQPLYRKGDRITWDGEFVCNIAKDVHPYTPLTVETFTNWAGTPVEAGTLTSSVPWLRVVAGKVQFCIDGVFR